MSEDLKKLESAFRKQAEVSPRASAKADAMKLAMQAFEEEKITHASQGMEETARPTNQGNEKKPLFDWKNKMKSLNSKFGFSLMGGASLAVLAFVMVAPNISQFTTRMTEHQKQHMELADQNDVVAQPQADIAEDVGSREQVAPALRQEIAPTISKVPAARADAPVESDDALSKSQPENELALTATTPLLADKAIPREVREYIDKQEQQENQESFGISRSFGEAEMKLKQDNSGPLYRLNNGKFIPNLRQGTDSKRVKVGRIQHFSAGSGSVTVYGNGKYTQCSGCDLRIPQYQNQNRDNFEDVKPNPVKSTKTKPVSTFSVDVDTASYAFMRSSLNNNQMPIPDSIRVEELVNYFDYKYEAPSDKSEPFKANVSIMPTPWNEGTKLMSIGIKGYELARSEQPDSNLVFLIDTSGSMNQANKLPLLRNSFKLLLNSLKPSDTISIVAYAGSAGTVLEPTEVKDKRKILAALDRLHAGGSTAGGAGLKQAYALAEDSLKDDGVNRVILATDGDFNVGISDPDQLKRYVEKKRKSGVTLSVLGFGRGNYNDELMQKLAQNGNGNASYIDTLSEARKVLVEEAGSTLFTIAKDVKLQVEFNPGLVSEYRLIGYETRALKREDFNNDKVDAGDIGAGHTVTALYEITPVGAKSQNVDPLRYANKDEVEAKPVVNANPNEYGFMKIRYKLPDSDTSTLISTPITLADEVENLDGASQDLRFAAAVAAFGQLLKGGEFTGDTSYDEIIKLALSAKGSDEFGYRAEFINLVRLAKSVEGVQ